MSVIKNVILAGASGNLGSAILEQLILSGRFNVSVLKRPTSKATFPAAVKVLMADFDSVESLTAALKDQDAVVSSLTVPAGHSQNNLIQACISAGVYRFLPSEFGCDIAKPKIAMLPVFAEKVALNKELERLSQTTKLTYTLVRSNAFLDWGLRQNFLVDLSSDPATPSIYDSGDQKFSATNLSSIGKAIVSVLLQPEATKNRAVYIKNIDISQNDLLSLARRIWPEKEMTIVYKSSEETLQKALSQLANGDYGPTTFIWQIYAAVFAPGYAGAWDKTDNELLGIETFGLDELEAQWKRLQY